RPIHPKNQHVGLKNIGLTNPRSAIKVKSPSADDHSSVESELMDVDNYQVHDVGSRNEVDIKYENVENINLEMNLNGKYHSQPQIPSVFHTQNQPHYETQLHQVPQQ